MSTIVRRGFIATVTLALLLVVGWQSGLQSPIGSPHPAVPSARLAAPDRQHDAGSGNTDSHSAGSFARLPWLTDLAQPRPTRGSFGHSLLFADDAAAPGGHNNPFPNRHIKAPSLDAGGDWINTTGPIDIKQLRGKFVLLDFWTYCCINCMHILPVLKKLEHAYPNELVVIGVHSAKFEAEQDSKNITDAVLRYDIEHPVVNDRDHKLWDRFEINSWPSLRVIDPEGYVVAGHSGEIDFDTLDRLFKKWIPYYRKRGLLDETPVHFNREAERQADTPLRFPGKVLADPEQDRLFIADSAHNRIVIAKQDGTLIDVVGSGETSAADGNYAHASFDHPQGMALFNGVLFVADTENHLLRAVDLKKHMVSTVAGTGKQGGAWPTASGGPPVGSPRKTALSSPWDLWVHGNDLYIAMAGPHQIWKMALPHGDIGPYAGNGREDIIDGPVLPSAPYEEGFASFAQPSGIVGDDNWLYVADSEGSSIRAVPFNPTAAVRTVIGTAALRNGRLFTFGDVDGQGPQVRLQHPLGVALRGGQLYVADTYNNKVKVIDLAQTNCQTLAGTAQPGKSDDPPRFDEPAGLSVAGNRLFVADTNNHAIRVIDLDKNNQVSTLEIAGLSPPTPKPKPIKPSFKGAAEEVLAPVQVRSVDGKTRLHVRLDLPAGAKVNDQAPLRYTIEEVANAGLVAPIVLGQVQDAPKRAAEFDIPLPLIAAAGKTTLKVSLSYYYCLDGAEGLCKAAAVIWTAPIEVANGASSDSVLLSHTQSN